MSSKEDDSTPTGMNRTDVQWSNTSKIHSSMCRLQQDYSHNYDEDPYNSNTKFQVAKKVIRDQKFAIDEGRENEDAMKIERLANGYGAKRPYIKQSTGTVFSDASGSNDGKNKTEEPALTLRRNSDHNKIRPKSALSETSQKSQDIEYQDPNERALHKIISNTLKYYQFNENYSTDVIMRLYAEHDLIKFAGLATNDANPRCLNSIIDMGEYPIVKVFNKKPMADYNDIENNSAKSEEQKGFGKLKEKKKKYSDLTFLPPPPNKYLDVITYSECSPSFEIREEQVSQETLNMTEADREEFNVTISQINQILKPLRGKVALYDRFILIYLIFGFFVAGVIGVILWMFLHVAVSIFVGILYFVILVILVYMSKKKSSTLIKKAHLCLALYLHVENNRYYKHKKIIMRPGYMAKWIEVLYLEPLIREEGGNSAILKRLCAQC
ncbi:unnamed protein product [Moneuplotes crassus]|uniref:Uncharacterized protein n=2 Tax=Euplotes crassus TaxID=5936 RepID=A0AAD1XB48_EUPCR|nr:unnamed protein product [Moneuplotes crassus]